MSEPKEGEAVEAGRCVKCHAVVLISDTFQRQNGDGPHGPKLHRIGTTSKNAIGEVCGPVASALLFHVVAYVGNMIMRVKLPSLQHPEENYDDVLAAWEGGIQSLIKARDEKGHTLLGVAPPNVVITSWTHVGAAI